MTINLQHNRAVHRFDHAAMNTQFSLRIVHPNRDRALLVAGACFRELDRMEACLSRYREDSDVARINTMSAGETLLIEEETYACLKLALAAGTATAGLFDVTLGAQIEHRKQNIEGDPPPLLGKIELAPERPLVGCVEPGRQIDLGGIGKGFGLDRMGEVLRQHDIDVALLSCGASTLLALGPEGWPVVLRGDGCERKLELCNEALSASGTEFQGAHVLHPETVEYAYAFRRVWVLADSAAIADAFSTACLVMKAEEIREFQATAPSLRGIFTELLSERGIEGCRKEQTNGSRCQVGREGTQERT